MLQICSRSLSYIPKLNDIIQAAGNKYRLLAFGDKGGFVLSWMWWWRSLQGPLISSSSCSLEKRCFKLCACPICPTKWRTHVRAFKSQSLIEPLAAAASVELLLIGDVDPERWTTQPNLGSKPLADSFDTNERVVPSRAGTLKVYGQLRVTK